MNWSGSLKNRFFMKPATSNFKVFISPFLVPWPLLLCPHCRHSVEGFSKLFKWIPRGCSIAVTGRQKKSKRFAKVGTPRILFQWKFPTGTADFGISNFIRKLRTRIRSELIVTNLILISSSDFFANWFVRSIQVESLELRSLNYFRN